MSDFQENEPVEARHVPIPDGISPDNVVGIITVHDPQALHANRNTAYRKSRLRTLQEGGEWSLDGCHIFLHLVQGQACYTLGRSDSKNVTHLPRDVYLPGSNVGVHQFGIIPVWENNSWRLQSASETIAEVNGAPIQISTPRTRKLPTQLPQAIHLRQNLANHIIVSGLRVDICMLKMVREVFPIQIFDPADLRPQLQAVAHRPEAWARDRYIKCPEQISANSYRVLERFTGKIETAKFFRQAEHSDELRDAEFLKLGKAKVEESLVRYTQTLDIDHIPAVITETHEGFKTYAVLEEDIRQKHPRVRFTIASKLLRRLMSALAFLHFHKVVHGNVTKECILLRLVDFKPAAVLLVDYTNAASFPVGTREPFKEIVEDGRAAMEIVESCCDIWQLRKTATKDASSEDFMAKKTEAARKEFALMERVVADYFGPQDMSQESDKGKKMLRLLEEKQQSWYSSRESQIHNATRREIGPCRSNMITELENDWSRIHPPPKTSEEHYMVLTLGHSYLDDLASKLYHKRWDLPPRDVCTKIQQLAGNVEEPWQTFSAHRTLSFTHDTAGFEEHCIIAWLASCCEAYPEWRHVVVEECKRYVLPQHGIVMFADIKKLRDALVELGTMPNVMHATFTRLTSEDIKNQVTTDIEEVHKIWYHQPSRMFHLTQLHRLANPDQLLACINEGDVDCDNWIEVRGEPKIEGLYAPLSLLAAFGTQLGLTVEAPNYVQDFSSYDPADFSRVLNHVVLAHTGLLPWASVTRKGAQFNFHAPLNTTACESAGTFLPTYFGNMKMLPTMPYGSEEYRRPDHWSKFRTGKEMDEAANLNKRPILPVTGLLKKPALQPKKSVRASSPHVDQSILAQALETRKRTLAEARFSGKRSVDNQASVTVMPAAKRSHVLATIDEYDVEDAPAVEEPQFTASFMDRHLDHVIANLERQASPSSGESLPDIPRAPNTSFFTRGKGVNTNITAKPPKTSAAAKKTFTVASNDGINLEDDYKQAEEWLARLKAYDDAPQVAGIFGLNFHHSLRQQGDGSDTEQDDSEKGDGEEAMPKTSEKAKRLNNAQSVSQSFPGRSSFQLAPEKRTPAAARQSFLATLPEASGRHHRNDNSLSDLASVDLRNAPAQSSSPQPPTRIEGPVLPVPASPSQPLHSKDRPDLSAPAWMMRMQSMDNREEDDEDMPATESGKGSSQYSDQM
jgi:serine/threonine protein kinase